MPDEKINDIPETGCCPKFDPAPWDGKNFEWQNKKFIKNKVRTFMYIPLNFGSVMTKMQKIVEAGGAKFKDNLCLSEHTSKWNMDLLLAVDKEVAGAENIVLNGKYFSKVYEGNFQDTGKWEVDFEKYCTEKNLKIKKHFSWYTTCPKCAKTYGKNYVVIIAEIE